MSTHSEVPGEAALILAAGGCSRVVGSCRGAAGGTVRTREGGIRGSAERQQAVE